MITSKKHIVITNVFVYLYDQNMPEECRRDMGCFIIKGVVFIDRSTGQIYGENISHLFKGAISIKPPFNIKRDNLELAPIEYINSGEWERISGKSYVLKDREWFPLKLTHVLNKSDYYGALSESHPCSKEGGIFEV